MSEIGFISIPQARSTALVQPATAPKADGDEAGFDNAIKRVLDNTNKRLVKADASVQAYIRGEDVPIHNVMMELSQAELSLKLTGAVATKVIEAYQEITRIQL